MTAVEVCLKPDIANHKSEINDRAKAGEHTPAEKWVARLLRGTGVERYRLHLHVRRLWKSGSARLGTDVTDKCNRFG
eukprot:7721384-Karenia_brevis.AAC.1